MSSDYKQEWVATLLIDRLRYVMRGDAELFIAGYESDVIGMQHVKNREDALNFWKKYAFPAYGGGTNAAGCVREVERQIDGRDFFGLGVDLSEERPEILLLHDGQIGLAI